jgi:hypothetical protein
MAEGFGAMRGRTSISMGADRWIVGTGAAG